MIRTVLRKVPRLTWVSRHYANSKAGPIASMQTCLCKRNFFSGGRDPFTQMEQFMRDMERKFRSEFDVKFPEAYRFGGLTHAHGRSLVTDVSTDEKYRLMFNFATANPEDIKVTLKKHFLTIEAQIKQSSESSKVSQAFKFEYEIPEGVNLDALESSFSREGMLIIEAPRSHPEAPKPIEIKRET